MRQTLNSICVIAAALAAGIALPVDAATSDFGARLLDDLDVCLATFNAKARAKKLSPETFKLAIDGACTNEQAKARAILSLDNEGNPNQRWHLSQFDQTYADRRAKLLSDFIMGN